MFAMPRKLKTMELDFWFQLSGGGTPASGVDYIDLAQCASLCNRVFVRQGQQFYVSSVELVGDADSLVTVRRLPYHWPMANAWEKGYALWRQSQDQVLDIEPSTSATWRDFKIHMDPTHVTKTFANNLLPDGYVITGANSNYEWDASEIEIPNNTAVGQTDNFFIHALGDDTGAASGDSKGLIHGYALSRARPQPDDPNVPISRGWMNQMFDVGDNLNEIREDIVEQNDEPPYLNGDANTVDEYYPGGAAQALAPQIECSLATRATYFSSTQYGKGFLAPCGLLQIGWSYGGGESGSFPAGLYIRVTLAPGSAKGIMARPMKDVN